MSARRRNASSNRNNGRKANMKILEAISYKRVANTQGMKRKKENIITTKSTPIRDPQPISWGSNTNAPSQSIPVEIHQIKADSSDPKSEEGEVERRLESLENRLSAMQSALLELDSIKKVIERQSTDQELVQSMVTRVQSIEKNMTDGNKMDMSETQEIQEVMQEAVTECLVSSRRAMCEAIHDTRRYATVQDFTPPGTTSDTMVTKGTKLCTL